MYKALREQSMNLIPTKLLRIIFLIHRNILLLIPRMIFFLLRDDFGGKSTSRDPRDDDDDDDDAVPSRTWHVLGIIPDNTCICTWRARQTLLVRRALQPRNPGNLEDVARSSTGVILPIWAADYLRRREGNDVRCVRVAKLWFDFCATQSKSLRVDRKTHRIPGFNSVLLHRIDV